MYSFMFSIRINKKIKKIKNKALHHVDNPNMVVLHL